ncbi:MAG: carboxypeptidase-like regulatory domain-containing protein, partial [Flavobacterium sp.]
SESGNFDKEFNIPITIRRPSVAIEIQPQAINRPEDYWNRFRDTLDSRSLKTYVTLDSLVAKDNWERRLILGRRIINGYLPLGSIDLDLRQIIKYNNYEGFRVGLGGITNDKFAETFRISGYGAYGTKDGEFKYSLGAALRVGKFSNSWIGGSYTDDIREIASTSFAVDKRVFKIYDPRPINITTFYNHQTWQGYIETRILPKTESTWQLTRTRIDPKFGYQYNPDDNGPFSVFHLTMATASIQWNPFSDFMQTPDGRLEMEKRFPKFTFQYSQAISGILDSDFTFGKLDFRAEYEKKYLNEQKTSLLFQAGVAIGDTPLTHLYSTSPNSLAKDGILQRITFAGKNSFETMYFNEFFSSQYAILQLKHGLRKFTIVDKVKLSPVLVTRAAWGNMENREDHIGLQYNTLEKGYYESGLEFNEIYRGLGITAFYRYGPYHLPD